MKNIYFVLLMFTYGVIAVPLATNFTYQGHLKVSNALANGSYDFQFTAFDTDGLLGTLGTNLATVQVAAVNVVNGVFTVQLDFAGVVFQGDKIWLEIAVRIGGSTGGFQQLLPRQEVTSAPYAIQAQYVNADAITSSEIQDGSINSNDLVPNSIGVNEINSTEIQRRVSTSCSLGSFVTTINENGTVDCSTDSVWSNYRLFYKTCSSIVTQCMEYCPAGLFILGGGCNTFSNTDIITSNGPYSNVGWTCKGSWNSVTVSAICASVY